MKIFFAIFLLILVNSIVPQAEVKNIQQVSDVYNGQWYSGYIDNADGTHMHYFFFPSQNSPNDPVLLWLNGGPGCSSLLGALYQHGPFLFSDAFGMLMNNQFSWNKKANVLYLQSPAQVGYSYSDNNKTWTDQLVAELNLNTVINFFGKWKQYQVNDFYIAGQSYAGIYVPTLAEKIDSYNENPTNGIINLKGFAVGNGCTDKDECQFNSEIPHFLFQLLEQLGILPTQIVDQVAVTCKGQTKNFTDQCQQLLDKIDQMSGYGTGMNIYDVYRPCYDSSDSISYNRSFLTKIQAALRKKNYKWNPPCVDGFGINQFLNDENNRRQLHIPDAAPKYYSMCNIDDQFDYVRSLTGSLWVYQKLVPKNKYKIFVYSGDTDPAVPITGTFYWINNLRKQLRLSTIEYWRPWFTNADAGVQNAGNIWRLRGLTLITFRGVGHMAPQWNQPAGIKMINALLHNDPI